MDRDKQSILELVGRALEELKTMSSSGEPLWVRSVETGRDILNYDEYVRLFRRDDDAGEQDRRGAWSVEASREGGVVYLDAMQLVHAFMDVVLAIHRYKCSFTFFFFRGHVLLL
jgi:homeobox-leucine zipper protein